MQLEPVIQSSFQHYGGSQDPELATAKGSAAKPLHDVRARLGLIIHARLAYIPLLVCCFVSGITDSTLYSGKW